MSFSLCPRFFPYYVFILHKKAAVWIRLFKIIPLIPSKTNKISISKFKSFNI